MVIDFESAIQSYLICSPESLSVMAENNWNQSFKICGTTENMEQFLHLKA